MRVFLLVLIAFIVLFITAGCSQFDANTEDVELSRFKTRSNKYLYCVIRLSREGVKQSLIKTFCDSSLGSIED